ncbi:bifunctional non-homologous end joining protein LigD [Paenibacillus sp. yr247]|uniref:ATP-dependent DNA ligase n=1 Tax=Paenibacillus sp. yr247 TaxID=1761880 RepID=UPI0008854292|nr:RNA ligase family protein [Paenibacillus sp. yr247]SDO28978.1 bifunctional non-homologous end joining protein LigD [Paenibacillus sp. yr247]
MLFTSIKPMIVSIGKEAFNDENYIFEPKWDGWRILLHKQGTRFEAYTRNGQMVTSKFPELKEAAAAIRTHSAILDCEGIVLRAGRPVFDDFSYRGRISHSARISSAVHTHPATFVLFDVLYTDKDHLKEPLMDRKKRLGEIVDSTSIIMPTMFVEGQGKAMFDLTKERDMEGIVAKRKDSKYFLNTTSKDWLKIKHFKSIDVVILGYRTNPFGLVIGLNFRTVKNKPVGVVEFGFMPADKELFLVFGKQLSTATDEKTQWIEPRLCCRIEYLERTDTHQLRTTVFRGFLLDKKPEECIWES